MKSHIVLLVKEAMLGIREGVSEVRLEEYKAYLENLIQAKEADLDLSLLQFPMMTDRVKQGIEAGFAIKSNKELEGGIEFSFIKLGGSKSSELKESGKIKIDMEFMSVGAPDFDKLKEMTVENLKSLMAVISD